MNLEVYDEGVTNYYKNIFENTVWGQPELAFKQLAMKNPEEKVELPAISVFRVDTQLNPSQSYPQMKRGNLIHAENEILTHEKVIHFLLNYEVDCWARDNGVASELMSEVLFYVMDNPGFNIQLLGAENSIKIYQTVTEVIDNTDLMQASTRGRLARFSIMTQVRAHISKFEDSQEIKLKTDFVSINDLFPSISNTEKYVKRKK